MTTENTYPMTGASLAFMKRGNVESVSVRNLMENVATREAIDAAAYTELVELFLDEMWTALMDGKMVRFTGRGALVIEYMKRSRPGKVNLPGNTGTISGMVKAHFRLHVWLKQKFKENHREIG